MKIDNGSSGLKSLMHKDCSLKAWISKLQQNNEI